MATLKALFFLALFLCSALVHAARPEPAFPTSISAKTQLQGVQTEEFDEEVAESCDGVGEDECLMRRTLAAHTDYIYTQKHNP